VVKAVFYAINEADFEFMHQTYGQPTAYGFVDNPPLARDILKVVEKIYKAGGGPKRIITLDKIIK
jgi:hypothetical protein